MLHIYIYIYIYDISRLRVNVIQLYAVVFHISVLFPFAAESFFLRCYIFRPAVVTIIRELEYYDAQAAYNISVSGKHIYISIM